jgi:Fe-S-cluster-containing hydrogenase component 2
MKQPGPGDQRRPGKPRRSPCPNGSIKVVSYRQTRKKMMERVKAFAEKTVAIEDKPASKQQVCTICGKPATQLVDGEPSCALHVEQVYEHQVEDYTRTHLTDQESREV